MKGQGQNGPAFYFGKDIQLSRNLILSGFMTINSMGAQHPRPWYAQPGVGDLFPKFLHRPPFY